MTVRRNSAPVAPSTARWSQVSVIVISGAICELAVARDDLVARRADREDRRLRRVEHGDELVDVVHAEVRDRERAALEILGAQLRRRARGRRGRRGRPRSAASVSRSAPCTTGTTRPCGAATAMPMFALGKTSSASSAYWTFMSRWRMSACAQSFVEQVGDGDAHVRVELALLRDQLVRARHVGGHGELERRHRPRLRQAARDRLADVRERPRLDLAAGGAGQVASCHWRAAGCACARSTSSATIRPSGPVPRSAGEVDAALARDPARERRRLDAAVRRSSAASALRRAAVPPASPRRGAASATRYSRARTRRRRRRRRRSSPCAPMKAIVLADRDLARRGRRSSAARRVASASTSCVTLSVSSS